MRHHVRKWTLLASALLMWPMWLTVVQAVAGVASEALRWAAGPGNRI
jgi:hypothetical protein